MKTLPAHCASSPSMFTAIMPFAAQRKGTLSFDTTHCATLLKALLQTECSLQWLKRKVFSATPQGVDPVMSRLNDGQKAKVCALTWLCTSPLAQSCVRIIEPCEDYAAIRKHAKYDASFVGTEYMFSPMVFETLGAINTEGEEVLKQIFCFAAKRLGKEYTSYCGRAWARFSCNLQRSIAQANSFPNRWERTFILNNYELVS